MIYMYERRVFHIDKYVINNRERSSQQTRKSRDEKKQNIGVSNSPYL